MSKTYYPVYKSSSGDVGVGTTSPTLQSNYRFLQVNGSVSAVIEATVGGTRIGGFDSTSSVLYVGTIGSYPVVFRTAVDEKMRISANGNIGIGTSSPAYKLDVNTANDSAIRIRNGGGGANNGLALSVGSGSPWLDITEGVEFRIKGNTYANIGTWNSGNNTKLLIDSNGNIGIGTTSPTSKLHIYDSEYSFIRCTNTANAGHYVDIGANSAGQSFLFSYGAYPVLIGTNGGERVRIDTSGNVGIGTTSPADKLSIVNGNISLSDSYKLYNGSAADSVGLFFSAALQVNISGYSGIIFRSSAANISSQTERMRITSDGTLQLNAISTYASLTYEASLTYTRAGQSGVGGIYFGNSYNSNNNVGMQLRVSNDGTQVQAVTINNQGCVGIGTTSPTTKFEVVEGEIKAGRINSASEGGQVSFGRSSDNTTVWYIDLYGSGSVPDFRVVDGTIGSVRLNINSDGNVGIGSTSPSQKLDVNGTVKATSYLGDFKGRLVRTSTTQTITGNVALTIDVSAAYIHIITVQASGGTFGITGITYNNRKTEPEVDEIILIFKWPATGSGVINVSNIIGDTPAFNYGKATAVRLTSYKGTGGLWICEQIASNMDYTNL